ncbi:MAG: hypothetical protein H7A23_12000 [Leptospiraceae bacterium]|nr:hypothetical protein [Leptospiraceae bacterium]MCP5495269.1 hypothetical protein [Leptospiraceae bacterium]
MAVKQLEKIPNSVRHIVKKGLESAEEKGSLGNIPINYVQIENFLTGGYTGAIVFLATFGILDENPDNITSFVRVVKIARSDICEMEYQGFSVTREMALDVFSQLNYEKTDNFEITNHENSEKLEYGILLYQDVGSVAGTKPKSLSEYIIDELFSDHNKDKFSQKVSNFLKNEIFFKLKKSLYQPIQEVKVDYNKLYNQKIDEKVLNSIRELQKLDLSLPAPEKIREWFNQISFYYKSRKYIHGDLNPENVLIWEDENGYLKCKIIDFGEVVPKLNEKFTPIFWDFSRLFGGLLLDFAEEYYLLRLKKNTKQADINSLEVSNQLIDLIWSAIDNSIFDKKDEKKDVSNEIYYLVQIYLNTLSGFLNKTIHQSGELSPKGLNDYLYNQIAFFLFFTKYSVPEFKKLFSFKLAVKLYEYTNLDSGRKRKLIGYFSQDDTPPPPEPPPSSPPPNKKKLIVAGLSGVLILTAAILSYNYFVQNDEVSPVNSERWSDYKGKYQWYVAIDKCKNLGKGWRLPYRQEFIALKNNKDETESWKKNDDETKDWYWTGEEDNEYAYYFSLDSGEFKKVYKSEEIKVRCFR